MRTKLLLSALLLAGCATIADGGPDTINLMTSDGGPVPAQIVSKAGVQRVWLPTVITVPKSCSDISINIREDDYVYSSNAIISSEINPWIIGNLVFGGIPGFLIDGIAGNMCTYSDNFIVPVYSK